jgi:hypothetical protein
MSEVGHKIKHREKANDVFYTPATAVASHLQLIEGLSGERWLDPFKGKGAYLDAFPTENKDWCEITDGRDFFDWTDPVDVIVSNPPYSIIDKVLEHSITLKPRIISFLIGQGNLTARRVERMNLAGYGISKVKMMKIFAWYGLSYAVVFERGAENCLLYDRVVHR